MKILDIYEEAWVSQASTIAIYGTIGSGKSTFAAGKLLYRAAHETNANFLALRANGTTCRGSVWAELIQCVDKDLLQAGFEIKEHEMVLVCRRNGNEIKCLGCNDADKLKSVVNVRGIWLEEAIDFTKSDFTQMHFRMRGVSSAYPQLILTSNKSNPYSWQKNYFFENPKLKDTLLLETSYKQNPFITKADIIRFEEMCGEDAAMRAVYLENKWATIKKGNPFYWAFDENKHVSKTQIPYNENFPINLSFDFNRNPYCTCLVWQRQGEKTICLEEFCLGGKKANSDFLSNAVAAYLGNLGVVDGVFIYGDAAGKIISDTTQYRDYNDYDIIKHNLAAFNPALRLATVNPTLRSRNLFINKGLSGLIPSISILLNPSCKNTIMDFNHIQEDAEGGKEKTMETLENGIKCQRLGHTSDAADYFLTRLFASEFDECLKGHKAFKARYGKAQKSIW